MFLPVALLAAACSGGAGSSKTPTSGAQGAQELVGLFKIDPGTCTSAGVTSGSWFRMVNVGGTLTAGPYMLNTDSACGDKTWSPLLPGTDGGLRTGSLQPAPAPAFDTSGNGSAKSIVQPVKWFAVDFALATNAKDPQTGVTTPAPSVTSSGGRLTGDLRTLGVAWNNQSFNQGAPKPDGSHPGLTSDPSGTYDPATHRYTLQWSSTVVGGPFNNFTGIWHLEGTFEAG